MSSGRTLATVAVCLLAAIVLVLTVAVIAGDDGGPGDREAGSGNAPGRAATPSPSAGSATAPDPESPSASGSAAGSAGESAGESADSSAGPSSSASAGGEMVAPPAGSPTDAGYRLPDPSAGPRGPLLGASPPASGTAQGRLVAGFPAALGPPAGAEIETSGLAVVGRRVQASLVLSGGEQGAILQHYRQVLSARGFVESPSQGVENDPSLAMRTDRSSVVVAIRDGSTYLMAHLRVGRS